MRAIRRASKQLPWQAAQAQDQQKAAGHSSPSAYRRTVLPLIIALIVFCVYSLAGYRCQNSMIHHDEVYADFRRRHAGAEESQQRQGLLGQ